jgi:hypothetical protein
MRPRALTATVAALLVAVVIGACGGASGNGVAAKAPAAIVAATRATIESAKTVHVTGSLRGSGLTIGLDLDLVAGRGGQGVMTLGGHSVKLRVIGKEVYFNASRSFWVQFAGAAAAHLLPGEWLKMPASTPDFSFVVSLTNLRVLFNTFLPVSGHPALTTGSATTIAGQKVIPVLDASIGATLYVATTGPPYLVAFTRSSGGRLLFERYNEAVKLAPPPDTISILQLTK